MCCKSLGLQFILFLSYYVSRFIYLFFVSQYAALNLVSLTNTHTKLILCAVPRLSVSTWVFINYFIVVNTTSCKRNREKKKENKKSNNTTSSRYFHYDQLAYLWRSSLITLLCSSNFCNRLCRRLSIPILLACECRLSKENNNKHSLP